MPSAELAWAQLQVLNKQRYDALLGRFGSLDEAWMRLNQELLCSLGCHRETAHRKVGEAKDLHLDEIEETLQQAGVQLLTIADQRYPSLLREIADPPIFLFAQGHLDVLAVPTIAIVGTRAMSSYGRRVVHEFVPPLVHAGLVTVSGLARGVDAEVARETIGCGGRTIAVLGHGFGAIYPPTNTRLAQNILEHDGLLLTEYPWRMPPSEHTFPQRNRIIAGLSLGTLVIEAPTRSGSLITASLALEENREVFAVPSTIFDERSQGAHALIAKGGALLVASARDILERLGMETVASPTSHYRPRTPEERLVHQALSGMPQSANDIASTAHLTISTVNATLTRLELSGAARNTGMGMWVREG